VIFIKRTQINRSFACKAMKAAACAVAATAMLAAQPAAANSRYAAYVYDVNAGKSLFARHADAVRYPASLTKMMTLYVLFEELHARRLTLDSKLTISRYAAGRPPSKLGLRPGSTIAVKHAIMSLVTKSANDIATAVAENISGSEANFGKRMTRTARRLGMSTTTFYNASGLPHAKQRTSAHDMMRLGLALQRDFPSQYRYFNTTAFKYGGRTYGNHNKLLRRVKGVDGIKTGYTRASGFNLVSNVKTDGRHIIAVVMGGKTGKSRDTHMRQLIARYLPKAKRSRGKSMLMVAAPSLPSTGRAPQPLAKPGVTDAIVVAAVTTPAAPPAEPAAYAQEAKTPAPMPSIAVARIDAISSKPDGWLIQIGAMPSKSEAIELLGIAKTRAKSTLKGVNAFTETIEKGGLTLHRARFAGFNSKASARQACNVLKKKDLPCLALPPQ